MAVSQHFMAWKCEPLLNNYYLYYWLQAKKSEFKRIAMGNTIKTIGLPYFRQLVVPLPTKAEQEAIAEALSDADALIEFVENLLVKKRYVKQGAMQDLLTGKERLPGFSGEWDVKRLGDVIKAIGDGATPSTANPLNFGGPIQWVVIEDIRDEITTTRSTLTERGL